VRFSFDDAPAGWDAPWERATAYWEGRGFRCGLGDPEHLVGRRGTWLGNLFGMDVGRLVCDLTVGRTDDGRWSVRQVVEGAFQYLTEWNLAELGLEQILFRRALLGYPPPPFLERYRAATRRASVIGSLTLTLGGRRLPRFWEQLFRELAAPYDLPVTERVRA
jgi:hypothetical protein